MDYTKISESEILDWLKNNLDKKRYEHSLGTAECAKNLALKFGQNPEKAYIAGLLHDCAKCFSFEKSLEVLNNADFEIYEDERNNKKTIHSPVSAVVAKNIFGVSDLEILDAIRWHTLGKINMTDFEKIIFLADKIEPRTRTRDYLDSVRDVLNEQKGLNKAMFICYKETIKSLVQRELTICPLTIEIYNNLLNVSKC